MSYSVIKLQSPFEKIKLFNVCSEVALRRAIIIQAIIDASNVAKSREAIKATIDAKKWIFEENKEFNSTCEEANLEPCSVRKIAKEVITIHHSSKNNQI